MGNRRPRSLWLLLVGVFVWVSAVQSVCTDPLARRILGFQSANEPAVLAILRFGRETRIPLGIVVDKQLCSARTAKLKIDQVSGKAALDQIAAAMPSYTWRFEGGTVVFIPMELPAATAQFLSLHVRPYSVPKGTLQAQASYEWMNIRASLHPDEGTAFSVLSSDTSTKWAPLSLGSGSVNEVLDRLVGRGPGGAWILLPIDSLEKAASEAPLQFIDYSSKEAITPPCSGLVGHSGTH